MKKLLTLALALLAAAPAFAQKGYEVTVEVPQLKDTLTYLVGYYGKSNQKRDSSMVDSKGKVVFSGKEPLQEGMYMFVLKGDTSNYKLFDFFIDKDQNFTLTATDTSDYIGSLKVKGTDINQKFLDYQHFLGERSKEVAPVRKELTTLSEKEEKSEKDEARIKELREQMQAVDKKVKAEQQRLIQQNPGGLFENFLAVNTDPEVPEAIQKDRMQAYYYYKNHYFDGVDFTDERLWYTPVLYNRVEYYLDKVAVQHPDSIVKESIMLIEKARANKELFKFLVANLTYRYETSKMICFDKVFVELSKKYYLQGEAFWIDDTTLDKFKERVAKLEPILCDKKAPNLSMQDTTLRGVKNLYDVDARYTIVFFMDPDCGHCKKEMKKLKEVYNRRKDLDMEVYAVFSDTSMKKMKKYIKEHELEWINVNGPRNLNTPYHDLYDINSTPQIYILDEQKRILSKKLPAEHVEGLLDHEEKRRKGAAAGGAGG